MVATFGYLEIFELLLRDPRTDLMINDGVILKIAVINGRIEIVRSILSKTPHLSAKSSPINEILNYNHSSTDDHTQAMILKECLKTPTFDLYTRWSTIDEIHSPRSLQHSSLLVRAALQGDYNCLQVLLSDYRFDYNVSSTIHGVSVLSEAVHCEYPECITILLIGGKQRNLQTFQWEYALISAVNQGCCKFVKAMLELKCKNFRPDFNNGIIIILAMKNDDVDMLKTIMNADRINLSDDSSRYLRYAINHRKLQLARILITDVRVDPSIWNNVLLSSAIRQHDLEIIDLLLKDHRVQPTNDILMTAVQFANVEAVQRLVELPGLTVNEKMLRIALKSKSLEIINLLLTLDSEDLKEVWIFCNAHGYHEFADQIHRKCLEARA